ncbi:MAG: hypothetical protein U0641_05660 [Anaerolineae bacterium]
MADVYVDYSNVTASVVEGTLKVQNRLNARTTCTFSVISDTFTAEEGQVVQVYQDGFRFFEGTVDEQETSFYDGGLNIVTDVTAVSHDQLADRFLVAGAFGNADLWTTCNQIIGSCEIMNEGITNGAQTGPFIDTLTFNYVTVAEAFNILSELTGYVWYIDQNRVLNFYAPSDPNNLTLYTFDGDDQIENLRKRNSRANYRNVQYITGGEELLDPVTESFKGYGTANGGTNKTYTLRMPVGTVPTVTVNGTGKTVGINGISQGKDWYWSKGSADIVQDANATPLATSDTLSVTYRALVPMIMLGEDFAQIEERQGIEGGSGRYEALESRSDLYGHATADALANALLRKYGNITEELTFTSYASIQSGRLAHFERPGFRTVGDYLVTDVTLRDNQEGNLVADVKAVKGEPVGGWIEFFKKLAAAGRKKQYNENQLVLLLRALPQVVTVHDAVTVETGGAWVLGTGKLGFVQMG